MKLTVPGTNRDRLNLVMGNDRRNAKAHLFFLQWNLPRALCLRGCPLNDYREQCSRRCLGTQPIRNCIWIPRYWSCTESEGRSLRPHDTAKLYWSDTFEDDRTKVQSKMKESIQDGIQYFQLSSVLPEVLAFFPKRDIFRALA